MLRHTNRPQPWKFAIFVAVFGGNETKPLELDSWSIACWLHNHFPTSSDHKYSKVISYQQRHQRPHPVAQGQWIISMMIHVTCLECFCEAFNAGRTMSISMAVSFLPEKKNFTRFPSLEVTSLTFSMWINDMIYLPCLKSFLDSSWWNPGLVAVSHSIGLSKSALHHLICMHCIRAINLHFYAVWHRTNTCKHLLLSKHSCKKITCRMTRFIESTWILLQARGSILYLQITILPMWDGWTAAFYYF